MIDLIPTKKGIFIRDATHENDEHNPHIDEYCVKPPFFSLWNYRNLRKRSIISGFVGPRGSGKSVGAARTVIIDYMLRGNKVWSNMEIGFNLISNGNIIPMKSKPLDKLSLVDLDEVYSDGVIYIDEANMTAEARRAMSHENVAFSWILQQLRKRRLNIIWSAQSENHCEERLRWQTDIFILCEDVSIRKPKCGIGELSIWRAHDFSGVVKGRTFNNSDLNIFYQGIIRNKPWWNAFNTWQLQGRDEEAKEKEGQLDSMESEAIKIASEIAGYMEEEDLSAIKKRYLWKKWGVKDINMMMRIGQILSLEHGIVGDRREYRFEDDFNDITNSGGELSHN